MLPRFRPAVPSLRRGFFSPARPFAPLLLVSLLSLGACASNKEPASPALDESEAGPNDPFQSVNRVIWDFDMKADKYVLRPVAVVYRDNVPGVIRGSIANVLRNMKQPLIMANDVLQLNPQHFSAAFARFITNSIFGLGGIFDPATQLKIPYHDSDLGQTFGRYGIPAGPYLVLPILGPSDPRDAIGYGVESVVDPVDFEFRMAHASYVEYTRAGIGIVSDRSEHIEDLDELRRSSLDFYAAARSLYQQQRAAAVANAAYHEQTPQAGNRNPADSKTTISGSPAPGGVPPVGPNGSPPTAP